MNNITGLLKRKAKELDIFIIEKSFDIQKNLHLLCKTKADGSYVVYSSYFRREEQTSYNDFYDGVHNLPIQQAINEYFRRVHQKVEGHILI